MSFSMPPAAELEPLSDAETSFNNHDQHTPPQSQLRPPRAIAPPTSHPHPHSHSHSRSSSRVTFDLQENRRYFSAPQPLGLLDTKSIAPASSTRHISLYLGNSDAAQDSYMPSGRPRGESDLSRPSQIRGGRKRENGYGFSSTGRDHAGEGNTMRHSLPTELLTAILLPLPYLLSSLLNAPETRTSHAKHSSNLEAAEEILEEVASTALPVPTSSSSLIHACALTAGTLLLVGLIGRILYNTSPDRRKQQDAHAGPVISSSKAISTHGLRRLLLRMVNVGLPFLATVEIGGVRTGMILLCAVTAGLISPDVRTGNDTNMKTWRRALYTRRWTCALFITSLVADILYFRTDAEPANLVRGYVALGKSVLFLQPPLPTSMPRLSKMTPKLIRQQSLTSMSKGQPSGSSSSWEAQQVAKEQGFLFSPLVCTSEDINYTITAGAVLGLVTLLFSTLLNVSLSISYSAFAISFASIGSAAALYSIAQPLALRSRRLTGLATGLALCTSFGIVSGLHTPLSVLAVIASAGLGYGALYLDLGYNRHTHEHAPEKLTIYTKKTHEHEHAHVEASWITDLFLRRSESYPLLHGILLDSESRHIIYFMFINLTFMFIQGIYAYLSGSLGLFSDTIHMFFDCAGLLVGLIAAVMSKWPPSVKFPYGYGKIETLSGLGNGIFLMFVSVEIIWESFERFVEGVQLKRVTELLLVATAGLAVNLIGLKFIGHAHHGHGHDHGHSHSHGHGHDHGHSHEHSHGPDVDILNSGPSHGHNRTASLSHHHAGHANENMAGIYLHILADTMGSVAVIASSLLTMYSGWSGWDPIASCVIAILIIAASYPLVVGSAKRLLLTIPSEVEWRVRGVLGELSAIRGVAGYAVPRFWLGEGAAADEEHGHGHSHAGACGHDHGHANGNGNGNSFKQVQHGHTRLHSHDEHEEDEHHDHHDHDHDHHDHKHDHSHAHDHAHSYSPSYSPSTSVPHSRSNSNSYSASYVHYPNTPTTPITPITPITPLDPHAASIPAEKLHGVIHIIAAASANSDDVRRRVTAFLRERNMDVLVQVDREGAGVCWCGSDRVGGMGPGANGDEMGRRRSTVVM